MLRVGDIIDNTYQIINEIGSGGMGVVYLAYHLRLEKYIVLKKIKMLFSDIAMLRNEVDILKSLHHRYLPQVYDFIEYNSDIYTVIDYISGYDLEYYINNRYTFSESQLTKWLKQLCEVLQYLHEQNPPVLHTDIKPANIIVTENEDICLIDFGISLGASNSIKGYSKNYSSPEQYENILYASEGCFPEPFELDGRTDIYSLGATFYHMMSGILPDIENCNQPLLCQCSTAYSEPLISIIDKSMCRNREERFTSVRQMLSAIDNIKKLDVRYRRYLLLQILSSAMAGIMIISGICMMIFGNNEQIKNEYNKQYNNFRTSYEAGNDIIARELGNGILNDSRYLSFIDDNSMAQILHTIGESFYRNDDFANAVYYYAAAIKYADNTDSPQIYYRDYALALINNNNIDNASRVLASATEKYPDSAIISIISAQLSLENGSYSEAIETLKGCISKQINNDDLYTSYVLTGDAYKKSGQYAEAIFSYEKAIAIKKDISLLRKIGAASLALANENTVRDTAMLNKAKNIYTEICNKYFPSIDDVINLSQSYRLLGDSSNAKLLLLKYADTYDDYRLYLQLAFVCYESGDSQTALYCEKAKKLYINADDESKKKTDLNDIEKLKNLYNSYYNGTW